MTTAWFRDRIDPLADEVEVVEHGGGDWPSRYPVTDLAVATIGAAGAAAARLAEALGAPPAPVHVDRRLASLWFAWTLVPDGWEIPGPWDALAGDYPTADGRWIKLHTNAPRHRSAALRALGLDPSLADRDEVGAAVRSCAAVDLETAVVDAGGCAAALRSTDEWAGHPQGAAVAGEPVIDVVESGHAPAAEAVATTPDRPLAGVRVLDLTRVLAGPIATRFLAGLGADVLRVDPLDWDEPAVVPEVTLGKRCARIDVRTAAGADRLHELLAGADVLVHGYRPGALDGLGFGAAERDAIRPGLVEVTLDAWGWTGPWAGRRGFDSLVQMASGIAAVGSPIERPSSLPVQALDHAAGYLLAGAAIRGWMRRRAGGGGSVSRTSLARVARLLVDAPAGDGAAVPLTPIGPADLDPAVESTSWGPGRRLWPPLRRDGRPLLRWERGASALGTHSGDPRW